ncbi:MAG: D-serine ammonia-lyase [Burkholderiales bacterium]|nr:D-serine ammonia-lyase [Burkholderiales bacterium]
MTLAAADRARVPAEVGIGRPVVWHNPARVASADALAASPIGAADVARGHALWARCAPLLATLFPELAASDGRIDSALVALDPPLAATLVGGAQRVWVKTDHALPVTGCIKARGGVFEVLGFALDVATAAGFGRDADVTQLASPAWRARFARHAVLVGSTGNLGFSVGLVARALGFEAEVHLSRDAKAWKKDRLRALGVRVVEHVGDYTMAVAAARARAAATPGAHFVDDETSRELFVGYATAADAIAAQLDAAGVHPTPAAPLVVWLPCGVGGAPGGVTLGLALRYGDAVRCVWVEPVRSPCMLLQLAVGAATPVSVRDVGLDNVTVADGLAVAEASRFVAQTCAGLVDAVVTVDDASLLAWVRRLWHEAGLRLEPAAAAGFAACAQAVAGQRTSDRAPIPAWVAPGAVHVIWTTGGALLPEAVFEALLAA